MTLMVLGAQQGKIRLDFRCLRRGVGGGHLSGVGVTVTARPKATWIIILGRRSVGRCLLGYGGRGKLMKLKAFASLAAPEWMQGEHCAAAVVGMVRRGNEKEQKRSLPSFRSQK